MNYKFKTLLLGSGSWIVHSSFLQEYKVTSSAAQRQLQNMKQFANFCSQQSLPYTSLHMTGMGRSWEWVGDCGFTVVLVGIQADGCDIHVLQDSRGSWWQWQATHNVLFTVLVCSLSVTSECSLATAFITAFRGAANWKWNGGWALRWAGRDRSMW